MDASRVTMTGGIKYVVEEETIPGLVASDIATAGQEKPMSTSEEADVPSSREATVASPIPSTGGDNAFVKEEKTEVDTPITLEEKVSMTAGKAFVTSPESAENDSNATTG